jgi:hypothetical protein
VLVLRGRGILTGQATQAEFLEGDRTEALGVAEEFRERAAIVLQGPGLAAIPVVLQIDADQFPQHRAVEGVGGLGQVRLQVDLFAPGDRRLVCLDEVIELHPPCAGPRRAHFRLLLKEFS